MADEQTLDDPSQRPAPRREISSLPTIVDHPGAGPDASAREAVPRDESQTLDLPPPTEDDETGDWQPGAAPAADDTAGPRDAQLHPLPFPERRDRSLAI